MKKYVVASFVFLIAMLSACPAFSHTSFIGSNPERNSLVKVMPNEFRLEFNEDLLVVGEDDPNQLSVFDPSGSQVSATSEVAGPFIFAQALEKDFLPGKYEVRYRVVSADGHVVDGSFSFQFQPEGIAPANSSSQEPAPQKSLVAKAGNPHEGHENFIHVHSDHIGIALIALVAIGGWILYRKINNY